jgi:hypothetical protein
LFFSSWSLLLICIYFALRIFSSFLNCFRIALSLLEMWDFWFLWYFSCIYLSFSLTDWMVP